MPNFPRNSASHVELQQETPEAVVQWLTGLMQSEQMTPQDAKQAIICHLEGTISNGFLRQQLQDKFGRGEMYQLLADIGFLSERPPMQEPASLGP